MKSKKAGLDSNWKFSLLKGGASITYNQDSLPKFLLEKYDHYDSNVSIMKDSYKNILGRPLNEQEEDTLKQVLICMDGLSYLEISTVLELVFFFKRMRENL